MTTLLRVILLAFAILLTPAIAAPAIAQEPAQPVIKIEKKQLLVPRKGESAVPTAFGEDPAQWLREKQRDMYAAMSTALRGLRGSGNGSAAWTLLLLSFGYGIFHAAGPGHGKTVISTWLLATESQLRRGILVSFLSSIVQALSAITIVSIVLFVIGGAVAKARSAALALETISFALIGVLGLYLMWTAIIQRLRGSHAHHHGHHVHEHEHDADCGCGHTHGPDPKLVVDSWSMAKALSMSCAIGLRPCTGALLVLLAAYPLGLYWAGVASVFAMALGTFLAVSFIAAVTVYFRQLAVRYSARNGMISRWLSTGLRFCGGLAIAALGFLLCYVSVTSNGPLGG